MVTVSWEERSRQNRQISILDFACFQLKIVITTFNCSGQWLRFSSCLCGGSSYSFLRLKRIWTSFWSLSGKKGSLLACYSWSSWTYSQMIALSLSKHYSCIWSHRRLTKYWTWRGVRLLMNWAQRRCGASFRDSSSSWTCQSWTKSIATKWCKFRFSNLI